ncbi:hypothetical protein glysoja_049644 [Glycine soja]|uniref:Uncharacterized protein n=1 Tax=Glycine soja TaxID=3848 RepID=A0A0B2PRN2_GLYSO|nr:hypothetical protein glysoja_049644 [Glycine soja]
MQLKGVGHIERVQRKSHTKVELLSPIPKPPVEEGGKKPQKEEKPKPEEKKSLDKVLQELLDRVIKSFNISNVVTLGLDIVKNPWRSSCSHRV